MGSEDEEDEASVEEPLDPEPAPEIFPGHEWYRSWWNTVKEIKGILQARTSKQTEDGDCLVAHVIDAVLMWALKRKVVRRRLRRLGVFRLERYINLQRAVAALEANVYTGANTLFAHSKLNFSLEKQHILAQRLMYVINEEGVRERFILAAPVRTQQKVRR